MTMTSRAPARNPALTRNASNTLPAPSMSQPSASGGSIASTSVRRNLFPQAARRQVQHASSSSSSTIAASQHGASSSGDSTSNDIISRDAITGTFTIDSPQLPTPTEPTLEEEEEEARRRLIESWRKHGGDMVDQNEMKAVLMASLESKVQSLDEDGWMFGDEDKDDE